MTPLSKELPLPPRQVNFVEAYCMGQNATRAAVTAGYSIKTAHIQSNRMLRNVMIIVNLEDCLRKLKELETEGLISKSRRKKT